MILSDINLNLSKTVKVVRTQKIKVSCDICTNIYIISLLAQITGFKKYSKDLCRSCKQKDQYKRGLRKDQSKKAGEGYSKKYKGKSYKEIYGSKEIADRIKKKHSENSKGSKNPMYGKKYHIFGLIKWNNSCKYKKFNEIYGDKKSTEIKENLSNIFSGKNNPMYGKPSPIGSGNGWSGWYKGWYFRSLLELSFMVNTIERFGFKWETGENKKYKIKYKDYNGKIRNYFPDFILDEKYMIEVKPKNLHNSDSVLRKKNAALDFCKNKNLTYKLTEPIKTLSFNNIKLLIENDLIKFTHKYQDKWKIWEKENY